MFNKDNFEKLGEDIYVYHNFVTEEECDVIVDIAKSVEEKDWHGRFNTDGEGHKWSNRSVDEILPIHNRIVSLLDEGISLGTNQTIVRMKKGAKWGLHADNHDFLKLREASKNLKDDEEFDLRQNNVVGIVAYFNDFVGGCLNYPNQGVTYQPKKGDLVMHSSEENCLHEVTELLSEVRYSHSNNLFNYIKAPKGF